MTRYAFLFNHRAPHQLMHGAPIAFALSCLAPDAEVTIFASQRRAVELAREIGAGYDGHRVGFERLRLPLGHRIVERMLRPWVFLGKRMILARYASRIGRHDVIVVPEKTSLALKRYPVAAKARFVHTRHGAGDRAIGYDERARKFDLVLAAGTRPKDRLIEAGVSPERIAVVGYPKFDAVDRLGATQGFFGNDKPVVLYNPHYADDESSWRKMGSGILDWFAAQDAYNLIFAPHVLLYGRSRRHGAISLQRWKKAPNILLDPGSRRSVDMSYALCADIYLGDVSSQIYEFLRRPRPCIFLDAHGVDWRMREEYRPWHGGAVIDRINALPDALAAATSRQAEFEPVQRRLFAENIDLQEMPSAERAARAILAMPGG